MTEPYSTRPTARELLEHGRGLAKAGDIADARSTLEQAVQSGDPDVAAEACGALGAFLVEHGDPASARTAFEYAIACGHPTQTYRAALGLGDLLHEQGDDPGAIRAYHLAAASADEKISPMAAMMAMLLERAGFDADESAASAAEEALATGESRQVSGDIAGARAAFQAAIDSEHPEYAPLAACLLSNLLVDNDDLAGAANALRIAVSSGHPSHGHAVPLFSDSC